MTYDQWLESGSYPDDADDDECEFDIDEPREGTQEA